MPRALLDQVAPRVIAILLVPLTLDAVVLNLLKLTRIEVQPVGRSVIAKLFAVYEGIGITAVQVAVGFAAGLYW